MVFVRELITSENEKKNKTKNIMFLIDIYSQ